MNDGNDYHSHDRHKTLLIVEGAHEKDVFFRQIIELFPLLDIHEENIVIFNSNIYNLNKKIEAEYGEDWDDIEIDLPYLLGKQDGRDLRLEDFRDVFIVFDFDPQDTFFSADTIRKIQRHFNNSTEEGKLYINYPMVESYLHFKALPDDEYMERRILLNEIKYRENVCIGYKETVKKDSAILSALSLYSSVPAFLQAAPALREKRKSFAEAVRNTDFTDCDNKEAVYSKLISLSEFGEEASDKKNTNIFKLAAEIYKIFSLKLSGKTLREKAHRIYQETTLYSVRKSALLQARVLTAEDTYGKERELFESIEHEEILHRQLDLLDNDGAISVINTAVLIIPEYSYDLLISEVKRRIT